MISLMRSCAVAVLLLAGTILSSAVTGGTAVAGPNFLVIVADDMPRRMLDYMPRTEKLLRSRAVEFSAAHVQVNLCAPGRATLLSGRYAQNTGVFVNGDGAATFRRLEPDTVATRLQAAGYRTQLAGKYINGYDDASHVPPGWNDWYALTPSRRLDPTISDNGRLITETGHTTEVLGRRVRAFIQRDDERPFFAYFAVPEPHTPHIVPERHAGLFAGAQAPRPPSFNEADISDKPVHLRFPRMGTTAIAGVDQRWRGALRSLQLVDEQLDATLRVLPENTFVIFLADNGFFYGEHRISSGKQHLYLAGNRIPFLIAGPGLSRTTSDRLTTPADLVPTILELAGLPAVPELDGRSLVSLLRDPDAPWRDSIPFARQSIDPDGLGLRTEGHAYAEYLSGEVELYDLASDPQQLQNAAEAPSARPLRPFLSRLADDLASCSGAACRRADRRGE